MGVAVGGRGLGGGAVADGVAVLVGGGGKGVSDGTGCVSLSVGVSAGAGGLGLAGTLVGEGNGDGVDVTLGCSVGVGRDVFVAVARATRVLVGVGVTAGAPGAQRTSSNPTKPIPTRQNQNHRRLFIAKRQVLCGFPYPFKPSILYSRTEQAAMAPGSSRRRVLRLGPRPASLPRNSSQTTRNDGR